MQPLVLNVAQTALVSESCADPALWSAWAQSEASEPPAGEAPSYSVIPAGVRRRLSPLGRCALAAYAALDPSESEPTVWASSWGDISRTFRLTTSLAETCEVSPADFALSVHNAVGAQAAIWRKNHACATAMAAGPVTASCALVQARLALLHADSVVLVRYEEALPELWRGKGAPDAAPLACAWAARLTRDKTDRTVTLTQSAGTSDSQACRILEEVRFWLGGRSAYAESDGRSRWRWEHA